MRCQTEMHSGYVMLVWGKEVAWEPELTFYHLYVKNTHLGNHFTLLNLLDGSWGEWGRGGYLH